MVYTEAPDEPSNIVEAVGGFISAISTRFTARGGIFTGRDNTAGGTARPTRTPGTAGTRVTTPRRAAARAAGGAGERAA